MAKYINADGTLKAVREKYLACDTDTDYLRGIQQGFEFAMTIIRNQPTADVVEVKHGRWIRLPDGWDGIDEYERYKCSVCNQLNSWGDTPFCRWCGADMRERREDNA